MLQEPQRVTLQLHERQHDIFLSYSWANNSPHPLAEDKELGWIDHFCEILSTEILQRLGRKPNVWRDLSSLRNAELLTDQIDKALKHSKTLIVILSPSYINSRWCRDEMDIFYRSFDNIEEAHTHIYPIEFLPLDQNQKQKLPENFLRIYPFNRLFYAFYQQVASGPKTLDPRILKEHIELYYYQIHLLREHLVDKLNAIAGESEKLHKVVYIVETVDSKNEYQNTIRRFLLSERIKTLPEEPVVPRLTPENQLADDLRRCLLSILIVGKSNDLSQDRSSDSESQIDSLIELVKKRKQQERKFVSIFWKPKGLDLNKQTEDRIYNCIGDASTDFIIDRPLTEVMQHIHHKLKRLEQNLETDVSNSKRFTQPTGPNEAPPLNEPRDISSSEVPTDPVPTKENHARSRMIYLICRSNTIHNEKYCEIKNLVKQRGNISISEPSFSASPKENLDRHDQALKECNKVIVYDDRESRNWLSAHKSYLDRTGCDYKVISDFKALEPLLDEVLRDERRTH